MTELLAQMGIIRWPMLASLLAVILLTVWTASAVYGPSARSDLRIKAWIDGILFWGSFSMVAGILGSLIGFIFAAQSIEAVGSISTPLMVGGIRVAILSSAFGALILALSGIAWFCIQLRWRMLVAGRLESAA